MDYLRFTIIQIIKDLDNNIGGYKVFKFMQSVKKEIFIIFIIKEFDRNYANT